MRCHWFLRFQRSTYSILQEYGQEIRLRTVTETRIPRVIRCFDSGLDYRLSARSLVESAHRALPPFGGQSGERRRESPIRHRALREVILRRTRLERRAIVWLVPAGSGNDNLIELPCRCLDADVISVPARSNDNRTFEIDVDLNWLTLHTTCHVAADRRENCRRTRETTELLDRP